MPISMIPVNMNNQGDGNFPRLFTPSNYGHHNYADGLYNS